MKLINKYSHVQCTLLTELHSRKKIETLNLNVKLVKKTNKSVL